MKNEPRLEHSALHPPDTENRRRFPCRRFSVYGHVVFQSVALEHHGDVAVLRGNVVDQTAADVHFALGDLLQAGGAPSVCPLCRAHAGRGAPRISRHE